MHDVATVGFVAEYIRNHFAEGMWEQSFAYLGDGFVHVFFLGGNPTLGIFVCHPICKGNTIFLLAKFVVGL